MQIFSPLRVAVAAACLAVSSTALAAPVLLPVDGLDTADVNYRSYQSNCGAGISCITDASSLGTGGGSDHFDDAYGVTLNGLGYSVNGGDLTGSTLTLDSAGIGQFNLQVQLQSSGAIMRQLVTVTNNGAAGTASVGWHNNTGNDNGQQTIATSDGDLMVETSDRWVVTADNLVGTNNEVNSWILHGGNSSLMPSSIDTVDGISGFGGAGEQGISAIFDLSLGMGESASLLWFTGIEGINADGIALANSFNDTSSAFFNGLISDLSSNQLASIANWDLGSSAPASVPEPGSIALFGLGLLGLAAKRRRSLNA